MNISVILCTYNRCQLFTKALDSLAAQSLPCPDEWEVLVVDNNSDDQTRAVAEEYSRRSPGRFRYLFEPQPGKSHALNAGIREGRGEILAFIDDDVIAEPTWLQNLTRNLHGPEWAGAGGPILPEQSFSPPPWLAVNDLRSFAPLAFLDFGPQSGPLPEPPFGTNMAFRRETFKKCGGGRTDLGPRPNSMTRGEDTEFGARVLAAGLLLRYEPSARVFHRVSELRLQKRNFLDWWFDKGHSDLRKFGIPGGVKWSLGGIPLYLVRRTVVWTIHSFVALEPSRRFYCRTLVRWLVGQIVKSFRHSKSRRLAGAS